jgi:hypothetical protein
LAVSAAITHGINSIAKHPAQPGVPPVLLTQARHAARNGISLDTVLRRYFAGFALLGDFLSEAAEEAGWTQGPELRRLLRSEATLFDRLLTAVSEEHGREAAGGYRSAESRRVELIRKLLAGELLDPIDLHYDMSLWHLAAVASGPGVVTELRALGVALESNLLLARPDEKTVWAWLGRSRKHSVGESLRAIKSSWPAHARLALSEPGDGLRGWRLSHRQAMAAMSVAQRSEDSVTCYADVGVLASALQDDLLSSSLQSAYLAPLESTPDGGEVARKTLAAYLAASQNASSAAAALGVSRKTVSARLRAAEARIGRPLDRCARELETALKLRDLIL